MKLVFVCPEKHQAFETDAYQIIEDKGIKIGKTGNKVWDAKVELTLACPFCGKRHIFRASELPCPFS
ncbi:MAG: hypothetical protein DRH17_03565 [Deltaproteobacteria bacterium]|nr:hypothetical protein [Deltaproteobacteria bacterium]RLB83142.1 MAG: hypothetical protein DRH17_03565 [Deltaproteobacteria bacterium]